MERNLITAFAFLVATNLTWAGPNNLGNREREYSAAPVNEDSAATTITLPALPRAPVGVENVLKPAEQIRTLREEPPAGAPNSNIATRDGFSAKPSGDNQKFTLKGLPLTDPSVYAKYREFVFAELDGELKKREYNQQLIKATNWGGLFIGIVAHIALGFGLWAAWKEFETANKVRQKAAEEKRAKRAVRTSAEKKKAAGEETKEEEREIEAANEFEIGLEKIAFKSSLHGASLLVISIGIYYLFLKFVLPIHQL